MTIFKIIMILYIIALLWLLKELYKNRYDNEFEETMKYIDFSLKLLKENLKLSEENKKLIEQLKQYKDSNRVAKVIKEEKQ